MKKYIVQSWVNYVASDAWEFNNKKESLEFYKAKVKSLSKERKEENRQANGKFEDRDSWGYTWLNLKNSLEVLSYFKSWKEVKNEK